MSLGDRRLSWEDLIFDRSVGSWAGRDTEDIQRPQANLYLLYRFSKLIYMWQCSGVCKEGLISAGAQHKCHLTCEQFFCVFLIFFFFLFFFSFLVRLCFPHGSWLNLGICNPLSVNMEHLVAQIKNCKGCVLCSISNTLLLLTFLRSSERVG